MKLQEQSLVKAGSSGRSTAPMPPRVMELHQLQLHCQQHMQAASCTAIFVVFGALAVLHRSLD
jgi:hypothetical protein